MPDLADRARLVYQSNRERLWIWNPASKDWYKPAFWAVSGGGRGQLLKAGGHDVSLPYGVNEGRKHVARFSNFGGGKGGDPTNYGPIPNGLFEVGVPRHDSALGRCAELKPIQGLMMILPAGLRNAVPSRSLPACAGNVSNSTWVCRDCALVGLGAGLASAASA